MFPQFHQSSHRPLRSTRRSRLVACAAALIGVSLITVAGPADASTTGIRDPRGDSTSSLDVTNAKITLNKSQLRVRINVRDLGKAGAFTFSLYQDTEDYDTSSFHFTAYKSRKGKAKSTVGSYDRLGVSANPSTYHYDEYCPSAVSWNRKKSRVVLRVDDCVGYDDSVPVKVRVISNQNLADADRERKIVDKTRQVSFRP